MSDRAPLALIIARIQGRNDSRIAALERMRRRHELRAREDDDEPTASLLAPIEVDASPLIVSMAMLPH